MPVLSYLHHLFNPERCQAYIHTLRWKDRPLQCPRCQSEDVDPWGNYHYRSGCMRIPRISATQSTGMLPPSPEDFCHRFHENVAIQFTACLPPSERSDAGSYD